MVLPDLIQPFDLFSILENTLSGSMLIFSMLAVFIIAAMAARFRMNNFSAGLVLVLFATLMIQYMTALSVIVMVVFGFVAYAILGRIVKT